MSPLERILGWLAARHDGDVEVGPVALQREEARRLWKLARPRRRSWLRDYGPRVPTNGETLLDRWEQQDRQSRP